MCGMHNTDISKQEFNPYFFSLIAHNVNGVFSCKYLTVKADIPLQGGGEEYPKPKVFKKSSYLSIYVPGCYPSKIG